MPVCIVDGPTRGRTVLGRTDYLDLEGEGRNAISDCDFAYPMGGATLLLIPANSQLYGQWPMGGHDIHHTGKAALNSIQNRPEYAAGLTKWTFLPGGGAKAVTGVAVGPYNDPSPYGYSVYFGTDNNLVYRVIVSVNQQGWWVTQVAPGWPYQCDGTPVGTPVRGIASSVPAVYVSDSSGRIHCINADTGSRIWRSAQLGAITPPLYAPSPFGAHNGSRVYVGNSGWQILAFETFYAGSPDSRPPVWAVDTSGPILRTPSAGYGPLPLEESRWRIYVYAATGLSTLDKIVDKGASGEVAWTYAEPTVGEVCEGWATIANVAPPDVRMYFVGRTTANKARVYGVRDDRFSGPVRLPGYPVTRALDGTPPVLKDIGMVVANPCNDFGFAQPITYVLTRTAGSGTNRPSVVRVHDRSSDELDALAYFCRTMPSTADELSSSPTYSDQDNTRYLYFVTENGWLWAINPFLTWPLPAPFPVQFSSTVPRHDVAMDFDGAIIVVTNDGRVRATWGPR